MGFCQAASIKVEIIHPTFIDFSKFKVSENMGFLTLFGFNYFDSLNKGL